MDSSSHILLVDDSPSNLMVLQGLFSTLPVETTSLTSGREALEWLHNNSTDLILLDVMMPRMDGFEVCRKIKSEPSLQDIPILFLTAKDTVEDVASGFQCGAVDYIPKPFQPLELTARVEAHLQLRHSRNKLKETNHLLQKANTDLQELNLTKDRLLSIIAHDLRGPMSAFSNIAELLHREYSNMEPDDIRYSLGVMQRDSKRILLLLENLLEWARLQIENPEVQRCPTPLSEVVAAVVPLYEESLQKKELQIHLDIDSTMSALVDGFMLQTVLRNLISNAIKFSKPKSTVEVTAGRTANGVYLDITDHGVGIPEPQRDNLFSLHRVQSTRGTAGEKGSGLGLILCRELVERNGGSIQCLRSQAGGTTFRLSLES